MRAIMFYDGLHFFNSFFSDNLSNFASLFFHRIFDTLNILWWRAQIGKYYEDEDANEVV